MPSSYVSGCTASGSPLDLKTKWNWLVGSVLPVRRLSLGRVRVRAGVGVGVGVGLG